MTSSASHSKASPAKSSSGWCGLAKKRSRVLLIVLLSVLSLIYPLYSFVWPHLSKESNDEMHSTAPLEPYRENNGIIEEPLDVDELLEGGVIHPEAIGTMSAKKRAVNRMITFIVSLLAGAVAGAVGVGVAYPFDSVKTKQQTMIGVTRMWDVVRIVLETEGVSGFYHGIKGIMCGEAVIKSVAFTVNTLILSGVYHRDADTSNSDATLMELFVAATASGLITAFISNPIERVKIIMQADRHASYESEYDVICQILNADGWWNFIFRGIDASIAREVPGYQIYFVLYSITVRTPEVKSLGKVFGPLLCGGVAGMLSWIPIYPFDVAKTFMQNSVGKGSPRWRGSFDVPLASRSSDVVAKKNTPKHGGGDKDTMSNLSDDNDGATNGEEGESRSLIHDDGNNDTSDGHTDLTHSTNVGESSNSTLTNTGGVITDRSSNTGNKLSSSTSLTELGTLEEGGGNGKEDRDLVLSRPSTTVIKPDRDSAASPLLIGMTAATDEEVFAMIASELEGKSMVGVMAVLYKYFGFNIFVDGITPKLIRAGVNHSVTFTLFGVIMNEYTIYMRGYR